MIKLATAEIDLEIIYNEWNAHLNIREEVVLLQKGKLADVIVVNMFINLYIMFTVSLFPIRPQCFTL